MWHFSGTEILIRHSHPPIEGRQLHYNNSHGKLFNNYITAAGRFIRGIHATAGIRYNGCLSALSVMVPWTSVVNTGSIQLWS